MSTANGFHPPPSSTGCNGQSETSKRLPSTSSTSSTSSNSTTATNKRLKTKIVVSTTMMNEKRSTTKGFRRGMKSKESCDSNKKHSITSDSTTKKVKISSLSSSSPPPLSRSRHLIQHPILHQHKKSSSPSSRNSQLQHIPSSSETHHNHNRHHHHHHHHHHHRHVINNDFCDSCGECYGELISCDTCPATFHLLCANPPLSREDVPTGSYFCENCRAKTAEEEAKKTAIPSTPPPPPPPKPFSFDPKKKLAVNGFKQSHHHHHQQRTDLTLGQIKLPTAPNGRSLVQPSGEIKFRATSNKNRPIPPSSSSSCSSSNLKRKRVDSSPPTSIISPMKLTTLTPQIDVLRRLLISCRPEEFRGPSLPFDDSTYTRDDLRSDSNKSFTWQKYCFICRKSSSTHGPSIHCDYCPLTYHLDCLTPPMTAMPSSTDKWMCPNHIEPILDRHLLKTKFDLSERIKLYQKYAQIESNTIIQEFTRMRQTKQYLLSNTINNDRLERIDISQIPKVIEEFYSKANLQRRKTIDNREGEEEEEREKMLQTSITTMAIESSNHYDPCVWDILQAILDHIVEGRIYELLSLPIENDTKVTSSLVVEKEPNVLDTLDILLDALNESNYTVSKHSTPAGDGLAALVAAASRLDNEQPQNLSSSSQFQISSSLSLLIDLTQFRSSHAALIHTRSRHVLYIQKHVIWFGSSTLNDVCLNNFNDLQTCRHVSERHACLYYDRKRNLFELLNYSEYGTIINGLRYGLGNISDDDDDDDDDDDRRKIENEYLQRCFCLTAPAYHSAWDGPARIEQGTVIKIGCHEFIFYRHVVR